MNTFSIKHFAQQVYHHCGLNYLNNLSSLENKISRRMEKLQIINLWDYCRHLEQNPEEWDAAIEALTINETYFFREEKQLLELKDVILPLLKEKKLPGEKVRIWSAACSTGEEPYTLAMMVKDTGLFKENEIEIVATDINKRVLELAEKGVYNKTSLSFRRIPNELLSKYFHEYDTYFKVKDEIKDIVQFSYLNLLDDRLMEKQVNIDVVFCRNVLIYFDHETIRKVVTHFHQSINSGGYLFLGHSENISSYNIGFKSLYTPKTFYYQKEL